MVDKERRKGKGDPGACRKVTTDHRRRRRRRRGILGHFLHGHN